MNVQRLVYLFNYLKSAIDAFSSNYIIVNLLNYFIMNYKLVSIKNYFTEL